MGAVAAAPSTLREAETLRYPTSASATITARGSGFRCAATCRLSTVDLMVIAATVCTRVPVVPMRALSAVRPITTKKPASFFACGPITSPLMTVAFQQPLRRVYWHARLPQRANWMHDARQSRSRRARARKSVPVEVHSCRIEGCVVSGNASEEGRGQIEIAGDAHDLVVRECAIGAGACGIYVEKPARSILIVDNDIDCGVNVHSTRESLTAKSRFSKRGMVSVGRPYTGI